ncbi:hypothetical protein [Tamilnaduibacter salinus]|uniref:hypothetical protein n=1 Tax=Tamilnaduibacter salinus TaxID=1484056 RepID=UPI00117C851F|nr:hypothetical protein [Tamilnaduibacter salinus]
MHVTFWIIQLITKYALDYHIDPIEYFVGYKQRIWGPEIFGINIYRMAGLANEPSGYAITVMPLIYLVYLANGKIGKLILVSLVTVVLTFSPLAFVLAFSFMGIVVVREKK